MLPPGNRYTNPHPYKVLIVERLIFRPFPQLRRLRKGGNLLVGNQDGFEMQRDQTTVRLRLPRACQAKVANRCGESLLREFLD
jgi:hypothetical protein